MNNDMEPDTISDANDPTPWSSQVNNNRQSNKKFYTQNPRPGKLLDLKGGPLDLKDRFAKHWYPSESPKVRHLVNRFNIELREAEICSIRAIAKNIEQAVVLLILTNKIFTNLSFADIALGLTHDYSTLARGCRFVWAYPFTGKHVETVWDQSRRAHNNDLFKEIAGQERQEESLQRLLKDFMEKVVAGRADKEGRLDPRCFGKEKSAANLVDEVLLVFLRRVNSQSMLAALMAEQ